MTEAWSDRIAREVEAQQIKNLYGFMVPVIMTSVVNGAIVGVVGLRFLPFWMVVTWFLGLGVLSATRFWSKISFDRFADLPNDAMMWGKRFALGSGLAGVLWGVGGGFMYVPGELSYQLLLTFVVGGMVAGAATTLSNYLPAFYAFAIPAIPPVIVRLLMEGDATHVAMAVLLMVFFAAMTAIAQMSGRTLRDAVRLRFENSDLVEDLSAVRAELESANENLELRIAQRTAELDAASHHKELAERALHQAQKMEAVGQLTGGIAHDFNNLLTVIIGSLSLVEDGVDDRKLVERAVGKGIKAAERGAQLTKSLLAFSRTQSLEPAVVQPAEMIRELMDGLIGRVLPENIELAFEPWEQPLHVFADRVQLETAVLNLILNARDAMPDGGVLRITTEALRLEAKDAEVLGALTPGPYVRIRVADSGCGMSEEAAERIFEPFFTTKPVGQGSGLGLSMVYGFVRQSGGHVEVESEVKQGTSMNMYFPQCARDGTDLSQRSRDSSPGGRMRSSRRWKVLVVEDDATVRSVAVAVLRHRGFQVLEATSGEAALEAFGNFEDIDLVFSDIVMPGTVDGLELARKVNERNPSVRVLLTTGYAAKLAGERTADWPVIAKPYRPKQLAETIIGMLEEDTKPVEA